MRICLIKSIALPRLTLPDTMFYLFFYFARVLHVLECFYKLDNITYFPFLSRGSTGQDLINIFIQYFLYCNKI